MESGKRRGWKRIRRSLNKKYRLVILNDTTFAEKFSVKMSPWGIIIGFAAITIIMTTLVISLVAFTPLREYIPGYGSLYERKQIISLSLMADSIEQSIDTRDLYLSGVLRTLNERPESGSQRPARDTTGRYRQMNTEPSARDAEFRKQFERDKGNATANLARIRFSTISDLVFFTPVQGLVINSFNISEGHFGADIVTRQDEPVKSTLDGTVIFSGFSAEDGNVLHVQHANNLVSIYKHCSAALRSTGDRVKSGEVIAIVGNTGEKSHGPHLHFELWFNGSPVNPQEFVPF